MLEHIYVTMGPFSRSKRIDCLCHEHQYLLQKPLLRNAIISTCALRACVVPGLQTRGTLSDHAIRTISYHAPQKWMPKQELLLSFVVTPIYTGKLYLCMNMCDSKKAVLSLQENTSSFTKIIHIFKPCETM